MFSAFNIVVFFLDDSRYLSEIVSIQNIFKNFVTDYDKATLSNITINAVNKQSNQVKSHLVPVFQSTSLL